MTNELSLHGYLGRVQGTKSPDAMAAWAPPVHLTPRESQIVQFVVLGESNKQIARRLGISDYTVRDHVSNLLRKAGVTKRSRLAVLLPSIPVTALQVMAMAGLSSGTHNEARAIERSPRQDFGKAPEPDYSAGLRSHEGKRDEAD